MICTSGSLSCKKYAFVISIDYASVSFVVLFFIFKITFTQTLKLEVRLKDFNHFIRNFFV